MHNRFLREAAKVGVGLVIADIICGLWLSSAGLFPLTILGVTWGASVIFPGLVLDASLIILLAHYGWNMRVPLKSPSQRTLLRLVALVFLAVAFLHLVRLAFGWTLILGSVDVPLWISWLGVIIPGYLSYASFHFAKK